MVTLKARASYLSIATSCLLSNITISFQGKNFQRAHHKRTQLPPKCTKKKKRVKETEYSNPNEATSLLHNSQNKLRKDWQHVFKPVTADGRADW